MKVICVKNGKGGDGKTVFSLNLPALLQRKGKYCLLIQIHVVILVIL